MNYLLLLTKLLPTILTLIGLAEKAFDKVPESGEQKKELVTTAAKAIVGGITSVSTGGQADTWNKIADPVSNIIDNAAAIAFPHED